MTAGDGRQFPIKIRELDCRVSDLRQNRRLDGGRADRSRAALRTITGGRLCSTLSPRKERAGREWERGAAPLRNNSHRREPLPHPGPLPLGEGETFAGLWKKLATGLAGCSGGPVRLSLTPALSRWEREKRSSAYGKKLATGLAGWFGRRTSQSATEKPKAERRLIIRTGN